MDNPIDKPSNESAFQYALVLALAAHLGRVEARFDALPEEPGQTVERTIWAQDLSTSIKLVRTVALPKLAEHYAKADVALNCPQGFAKLALTARMEARLLGPAQRTLAHPSTEELLAKVDEHEPFVGVSLHSRRLGEQLRPLLGSAVKIAAGGAAEDTATGAYLAQYLASTDSLPEAVGLGALRMRIDAVVDHLREQPAPEFQLAVYPLFKALVVSHLEKRTANGAEAQLRELGNNLMVLCAYPQAVQVYTEGICACDGALSSLAQLHTNRAIAYIGLNCYSEAVADLNRAVQHDRTFTPAWAQLGYCHLYLGAPLLALRCYLTALRAMAGEIYPDSFPDDTRLREQYADATVATVMPQFVQRLVLSIILTERRAEQLREPTAAIQEATARVRAILARLRAAAAPEDMSYFSYLYDEDFEATRLMAARANRTRPTILTPDVAQDVLASTNVEASAIALQLPRRDPPTTEPVSEPTGTTPATATETATTPAPAPAQNGQTGQNGQPGQPGPNGLFTPANLRGFFNNLGDIFGDVLLNHQTGNPDAAASQDTPGTAAQGPTPAGVPAAAAPRHTALTNGELDVVANALEHTQGAIEQRQNNQAGQLDPGINTIINNAMRTHDEALRRMGINRAQGPIQRISVRTQPARVVRMGADGRPVRRQIFVPGRGPQNVDLAERSQSASPTPSAAGSGAEDPPAASPSLSPFHDAPAAPSGDTDMPDAPEID